MRNTERVRTSGEMRALRDEEWLRLNEAGKTTAVLAVESGVSVQLLRRAISRARKAQDSRTQDVGDGSIGLNEDVDLKPATAAPRTPWWLELVPLFPIGPFTPSSECPHSGPIPDGSLLCCMVCSASGIDSHPALVRDPVTDPRPEPKTRRTRQATETNAQAVHTEAGSLPETRRQRRTRIFG